MANNKTRPSIKSVKHKEQFEKWYWSVDELKKFCDLLNISKQGRKHDLRVKVANALAGKIMQENIMQNNKANNKFNWSKEKLTLQTEIKDNISFGPNVRGFFKKNIGSKFVCNTHFMSWVKSNVGMNLADAIKAWQNLEQRKNDDNFRSEIAPCNNYLQYLRDLRDANPNISLQDAKLCWKNKKLYPTHNGMVVYEPSDLEFLTNNK